MTTLPSTTNRGKTNGIVINVPSTEPLVKLSALPKLNTFKNIYDVTKRIGRIFKPKSKDLEIPKP